MSPHLGATVGHAAPVVLAACAEVVVLGVKEGVLDNVEVDAREATELITAVEIIVESEVSIELEELTRLDVLIGDEKVEDDVTTSELDKGEVGDVVGRLGLSVLPRAMIGVAELELAVTVLLEDVVEAAELDVEMDELPDGVVNVLIDIGLDTTDIEDIEFAGMDGWVF